MTLKFFDWARATNLKVFKLALTKLNQNQIDFLNWRQEFFMNLNIESEKNIIGDFYSSPYSHEEYFKKLGEKNVK